MPSTLGVQKRHAAENWYFAKIKLYQHEGFLVLTDWTMCRLKVKILSLLGKIVLAYNTEYSQAVTHLSTNSAQYCLTSVIRRELVHSIWCGCRHLLLIHMSINKTLVEKYIYTMPCTVHECGRIYHPTFPYYSIVWVGKWANPSGTAMLGQPVTKLEQAPSLHPLTKMSLISKGAHGPRIRY